MTIASQFCDKAMFTFSGVASGIGNSPSRAVIVGRIKTKCAPKSMRAITVREPLGPFRLQFHRRCLHFNGALMDMILWSGVSPKSSSKSPRLSGKIATTRSSWSAVSLVMLTLVVVSVAFWCAFRAHAASAVVSVL